MDGLALSWQPDVSDYVDADRVRRRHRRTGARAGMVMGIAVAGVVAGAVIRNDLAVAMGAGMLVYTLALVFLILPRQPYRRWRADPALHRDSRADIDPRYGITLHGGDTGRLGWPELYGVLEGEQVFVVHVAGTRPVRYVVLAKRGLADPGQLDPLRKLLSVVAAHEAPR
jgi:hypothetical protein